MNQSSSIIGLIFLINCSLTYPSLAQGRLDRPTFFRDGQRQMEREIQRLQQQPTLTPSQQIEHPSQLLTIDDGQLRWQKSIFQEGGFSVWMPQGLQSEEVVTLNTSIGELSFEVFASHPYNSDSPKSRFIAAYSEPLINEQLNDQTALIEAIKQGIIDKTDFTIINSNDVKIFDYQGQEFVMQKDDEVITFRVYLIKNRAYVLAVGRPQQDALSEEITSYFDSFRLL